MLCFASMINVRSITSDDLASLFPLWYEQMSLLGQADRRLAPPPDALELWHSGMKRTLSDSRAVALAGYDADGTAAGYIVGWESPFGVLNGLAEPSGIIGDLVIDMHRFRSGVARNLVSSIRDSFVRRGIVRVVTISPQRHVTGQAFWRSLGAVEWMDCFWLP